MIVRFTRAPLTVAAILAMLGAVVGCGGDDDGDDDTSCTCNCSCCAWGGGCDPGDFLDAADDQDCMDQCDARCGEGHVAGYECETQSSS